MSPTPESRQALHKSLGKPTRFKSADNRPYSCPSCSSGVQCVACYLDTRHLSDLEEERELTMEGWVDDNE